MSDSSIRVVLVEESPAQRAALRRTLQADGDIVVVAEASTMAGAPAAVARTSPDVVALGARTDGGEEDAIVRIMRRDPRPILVVGGRDGGPRSVNGRRAIVAGAASVVAWPVASDSVSEAILRRRVRALRRTDRPSTVRPPATPAIVAIAASTGGPAAVASVLQQLRGAPVAVVLVQHIDERQVAGFAAWLERASGWPVTVAHHGWSLQPGVVTVGPGGKQLEIDARGAVRLRAEPRTLHMPSADRLFESLAASGAAARVVGVVLTGMGADGASGLLSLRQAGACTFAQDEASCAVFGMARAALDVGAVAGLTPLDAIGPAIARAVRWRPREDLR